MKPSIILIVLLICIGIISPSCRKNNEEPPAALDKNTSPVYSCDSTLYHTIYNYIEIHGSETKECLNRFPNILGVEETKREGKTYIELAAIPTYKYTFTMCNDSTIISYTIIHDWLICLWLSPELFDKYKTSFTFINPNKYSQYQTKEEVRYHLKSWQYLLRNDSLVFVGRQPL
jgi:hypothetical protein